MPETERRGHPYGLAVLLPLLAFGLTWSLWPWIAPIVFPLFLVAVTVSGWYGGVRPGLMSILLSSAASFYLLQMPPASLSPVTAGVQLSLFGLTALLFLAVVVYRRRAEEEHRRLLHARIAREAAEVQSTQLRALHEVSLALSSSLALEEVLQKITDLSCQLLDARYAALGVFGEDGHITQFITAGIDPDVYAAIGHLPQGKGLLGYLMRAGVPLRVDHIQTHPESVGFPPHHPPMKTLLGIPLRYKGELLGDLYLTEKAGGVPFDEADEELLVLFGAQAAAALANARLAQQIEGLAVLEERQRFGMDLHDSVIQSIYAIGLNLQIIAHGLHESPGGVEETLRVAMRGLDEVIRDIRTYIANLGPGRLEGKSFSHGLRDLAREVRMSGQIEVHVHGEPGVDERLDAQQATMLFQVVREALSNTVKHASASAASVQVGLDEAAALYLTIQDNGAGFAVPGDGFDEAHRGLRNMRQRVEALGGTFEVRSTPGEGTVLRVQLPLPEPTRVPT